MITFVKGNLFESPAQVLVNTVNTVGAMGKGIARDFKTFFPEMFAEYRDLCDRDQLKVGRLHLYRGDRKWILNFPTKVHWRNPSKLEYIEEGLRAFTRLYASAGINSAAFPPLGCGHGQLDFKSQVRPMMIEHLESLPIPVFIYPERPRTTPEQKDIKAMKDWLQSEPESSSSRRPAS